MVIVFDETIEVDRTSPANQGHDSLKCSKEESDDQEMAQLDTLEDKPSGDSYGEAIHSKGKSREPNFERTHLLFFDKLK